MSIIDIVMWCISLIVISLMWAIVGTTIYLNIFPEDDKNVPQIKQFIVATILVGPVFIIPTICSYLLKWIRNWYYR